MSAKVIEFPIDKVSKPEVKPKKAEVFILADARRARFLKNLK